MPFWKMFLSLKQLLDVEISIKRLPSFSVTVDLINPKKSCAKTFVSLISSVCQPDSVAVYNAHALEPEPPHKSCEERCFERGVWEPICDKTTFLQETNVTQRVTQNFLSGCNRSLNHDVTVMSSTDQNQINSWFSAVTWRSPVRVDENLPHKKIGPVYNYL